jgi:hypothetical protein
MLAAKTLLLAALPLDSLTHLKTDQPERKRAHIVAQSLARLT